MKTGMADSIGDLEDLKKNLRDNRGINIAILIGESTLFPRYKKNIASMGELENALKKAGYNTFFLFFENNIAELDDFDCRENTAFNISFTDLPLLPEIKIFVVIEEAEFSNFLAFPPESRVVVFAHNLSTLYAHELSQPYRYWLCSVLSDNADYFFLPAARLHEIPTVEFEKMITDYYPQEAVRGDGKLRLIPGGYFNIDYNYRYITAQKSTERAVLVAPTADWEYPNEDYLFELIDRLAQRLPETAVILRPFPGDQVTIDRIAAREFAGNVEIDLDGSFAAAAARSSLLISDPASNIKLSYAFSSFKPVLEYNPGIAQLRIENFTGFVLQNITGVVELAENIIENDAMSVAVENKIQENVRSRVANFTAATAYFVGAVEEIAAGKSRAEWIELQKNRLLKTSTSAEMYFKILQRNYMRHNNSYGIVYCYRMLAKACELFPEHPLLYYYLEKTCNHRNFMPVLAGGKPGGYYLARLLRQYPQEFQCIKWTVAELSELLTYLAGEKGTLNKNHLQEFVATMLQLLAGSPEGQEIIGKIVQGKF